MKYAKLINNYPQNAPRCLQVGGDWVFNPTDEMMLNAGYLPVIEQEYPEVEEGFYAEPRYAEQDGQIVQVWEAMELPPEPDELTPDEALDIILGGVET